MWTKRWTAWAITAVALGTAGVLLATRSAPATASPLMTVYKSPTCGCCTKWAERMVASGFRVEMVDVTNVAVVKAENGVPMGLNSCHTAVVDGYVIEGHVPAADVTRLLRERPAVVGLAVPGMPAGSPGMEGPRPQRYDVVAFDNAGGRTVYARW